MSNIGFLSKMMLSESNDVCSVCKLVKLSAGIKSCDATDICLPTSQLQELTKCRWTEGLPLFRPHRPDKNRDRDRLD